MRVRVPECVFSWGAWAPCFLMKSMVAPFMTIFTTAFFPPYMAENHDQNHDQCMKPKKNGKALVLCEEYNKIAIQGHGSGKEQTQGQTQVPNFRPCSIPQNSTNTPPPNVNIWSVQRVSSHVTKNRGIYRRRHKIQETLYRTVTSQSSVWGDSWLCVRCVGHWRDRSGSFSLDPLPPEVGR